MDFGAPLGLPHPLNILNFLKMVLLTSAAISDQERINRKIASNPTLADIFARGLDGTYHFTQLAQPTLEMHDNVRGKWRDFTDWHPKRDGLPAEIELGSELVDEGTIKEFVTYLAAATKGNLTENATRRTIRQYVCTFFACWARYANQHASKALRFQVNAFVSSIELRTVAPLSTAIRAKPIPTALDLTDLVRFVINDKAVFRTFRAKQQFIAVNTIAAMTGQRPGTIVESVCYKGSNECIQWRDISFIITPDPDAPNTPFHAAGIRFRNPKGHRDDEQHFTTVIITMAPLGSRATCLVTMLYYFGLRDGVFPDVETAEEIFHPQVAPTAAHILSLKETAQLQPVFRAEVIGTDGNWTTSETKALRGAMHNDQMRRASFAMGMRVNLKMYCWRRLASNIFAKILSDVQRDMLLTHTPGTHMFQRSYMTRTSTHDLAGLLHGRGEDPRAVALAEASNGMSVGRDSNAPTQLTVSQLAELDREPVLVTMREELAALKEGVHELVIELKMLDHEDDSLNDEIADLHGRLRVQRKKLEEVRAEHDSTVNRERIFRLGQARKVFFAGASTRQLTGEAPPSAAPRVLARPPLADKTKTATVPQPPRVITSAGKENVIISSPVLRDIKTVDPTTRLCDIVYRFAGSDPADEAAACVSVYLGLPERRLAACYPGESPTDDEKCPVCKCDCRARAFDKSGSVTVGSHIHACLLAAQQKKVQSHVEEEYQARRCDWDGCKTPRKIYATRVKFVEHVQKHLATLSLPKTMFFDTRPCEWLDDGEICGEEDEADWDKHFGQVHLINVKPKVGVHYCAICPEWHVDELGDGLAWEDHLWGHWDILYGSFSVRGKGDVDLTPIGVEFSAPIDNAVDYAHGTGFDGAAPEFHGEADHGVAEVPMHCPWCVYDESLAIEEKMIQFLTYSGFSAHVKIHGEDIADDKQECPVPSCGTHEFSAAELKVHMIAYHRIPLHGYGRKQLVKRLRLPPITPPPAAAAAIVDLTHTEDMDIDAVPLHAALAPATTRTDNVKTLKTERLAIAAAAVEGYCLGCSTPYSNIGKHIQGTKCRQRNEYTAVMDKRRVGATLKWDLTDPAPARLGQDEVMTHRCAGPCRRSFVHISAHLATACKGKRFRIVSNRKDRDSAPTFEIAMWLAEHPQAGTKHQRSASPADTEEVEPDVYSFLCHQLTY
ncbi:hypothetical protein DFH09DRAFT_353266 [Mycena vulgaris]|nr:hypothetical protein DFH09DRAFT_353266 [Mycena vulgaris]